MSTGSGSLAGKVCVVTGGAERVGRTISIEMAAAGADVVINHLDRAHEAAQTKSDIEANGGRCLVVEGDVADIETGPRIVDSAHAGFGRIDVLVNNASNFVYEPFGAMTAEGFDRAIGVIMRGPFFLSQAIGNYMLAQGSGKILAIAGNSLYETWPDHAAHTLAKCGLARMMEIFAIGYSPIVQCNVVAPHRILPSAQGEDRDLFSGRGEELAEPGAVAQATPTTTVRQPDAHELASLLILLATAPPSVTGTVVPLDGGRSVL